MNNSYSELYEAEDANLERSANRNSDHFNYSGSGFVDGYGYMELGSAESEYVSAVRLDDIRLVDAGLLDVGIRELDG